MCVLINPLIFFQTPLGGVFAVPHRLPSLSVISRGMPFGRSGSSGFVGGFRRLRLLNRGLASGVRSCRDRCRYKYTCRPKRIQFSLRGRLKLLRLSDDLCLYFCLRHRSVRPSFFRTVFLEDFGFNQFVEARLNLQLAYY